MLPRYNKDQSRFCGSLIARSSVSGSSGPLSNFKFFAAGDGPSLAGLMAQSIRNRLHAVLTVRKRSAVVKRSSDRSACVGTMPWLSEPPVAQLQRKTDVRHGGNCRRREAKKILAGLMEPQIFVVSKSFSAACRLAGAANVHRQRTVVGPLSRERRNDKRRGRCDF
jgi:hypothetical protein